MSSAEIEEASSFFMKLDAQLYQQIDQHYFDRPKKFKALLEVIDVLGKKLEQSDESALTSLQSKNTAYNKLLQQRQFISNVIDDVVKFQHGALNSCVETMGDVLTEYTRSKDEVGEIRTSLQEIREVLTSKKNKQTDLKSLYLRKTEFEETIRILDDIEKLKDAPIRVQHFIQQKKYLTAVNTLSTSIASMFNADMVHIDALSIVREQLMEQKGKILEHIVTELKVTLVDGGVGKKTAIRNARARSVFGDDETATVEGSTHESEDAHSESISESGALRSMKRGMKFRPADRNQWSLDLNEATEEAEQNLTEPSTQPSLYTRLLVNAVGNLQCEEDVERMMFEGISQQFHNAMRALKKQRIQANAEMVNDYQTNVLSFTAYTRDLLDSAILTIKNVIHFLRLLNVSKWRRKMNMETSNLKYDKKSSESGEILKLKEANINAILHFCEEVESLIVTELERHFIEQEVEEMSDQVGPRHGSRARPEDAAFGSYADTVDSDDDASPDDVLLICTSTVKLAAPIYRDVLQFNERLMKMLNEEVAVKVPSGLVLAAVQKALESDLLPLVQSLVNADMREIQTNSELFAPAFKNAVEEDRVCVAARNCLSIIKPLLTYWLQLPQHREQVATILDRVLRGYVSAAREEMESVSWKYPISAATKYKDAVLLSILADPIFTSYRSNMYDGKNSVEELLKSTTLRRLPSADSSLSLDSVCLTEFEACDVLWGEGMLVDKLNKDFGGIAVLASLAYSCDYLTIQISKLSVNIAKRAALTSSPTATLATTRATFSGIVTPKEQSPLLVMMQGGLAELAHVAEECFALLRGEWQISGYYYMRQLVNIQLGASQLYSNDSRKYDSHQEPDAMVTAFNHHLMSFQDALLSACPNDGLAVVLSPMCRLVPRYFMKYLLSTPGISLIQVDKLLKSIVACQQNISMLLESSKLESTLDRRLQDTISEEFDRIKRYVSMLHHNPKEFMEYMKSPSADYSTEELRYVWSVVVKESKATNLPKFEDLVPKVGAPVNKK